MITNLDTLLLSWIIHNDCNRIHCDGMQLDQEPPILNEGTPCPLGCCIRNRDDYCGIDEGEHIIKAQKLLEKNKC